MTTKDKALTEQQILATLYNNIELLDTEYHSHFITETGSSIFKALSILQEKGLKPSPRSVYLQAVKFNDKLKLDHLEFLKEDPTNFHPKDLLDYLQELKRYKLIDNLQNTKLDDLTIDMTKKKLDLDTIEGKLEGMLSDVHRVKSESGLEEDEVKFLSREDEAREFAEIIEKRKEGVRYSSGDSYLDKYLYNSSLQPQEISIIFGLSGSGKSLYVRNLVERRCLKSLPTLSIELEMSLESSLDNKMAIRTGLGRSDFSFNNDDDEEEFLDSKFANVEKAVGTELAKSKRYSNYYQLNIDSLDIKLLESYIIKAKKLMNIGEKDYLLVTIDLLTQMKDFNEGKGSTADNYTNAMDSLHRLCKAYNIHIMGVVQPKRESSKVVINCIEDVEKLRPNTEMLKNSSSIEERGRVIISIFRPMHILKKYCPEAPELDYAEDVLSARIIKQNNSTLSPDMYYKFNGDRGILFPYPSYSPELAFGDDEDEDEDLE